MLGSQPSASSTKDVTPAEAVALAVAGAIRSGGKCAWPRGIVTMKVLPRPGVLSTSTSPPWRRASSCTSARPMPEPSCVRARTFSIRWKRSKTRESSAGAIPMPVSLTTRATAGPRSTSSTVMPPSNVNLKALERRLRTIFSHMA